MTIFSIASRCLSFGVLMTLAVLPGTAAGRVAVGALSVNSDPSAAAVYVDGRHVGLTPVTVADLVVGDHRVRVVKAGYLDNSRVVSVTGGRAGALAVRLTARGTQIAAAGLKIVIVAGNNAVNVVQLKTAVAPVVVVLDAGGQPVAGAVVRFAISGGRGNFNGAQTISVTTDAAGRAAVTGLAPTSAGALQISATASFQGQTAVATIVQTNVMTAAQAASVAGAAGAGAGGGAATAGAAAAGAAAGGAAAGAAAAGSATAGGAAAGGAAAGGAAAGAATGGGILGMSATTLGIVGGAAAGGLLVADKVGIIGVAGSGPLGIYEGDFRIDVVETTRDIRSDGTVSFSCAANLSFTGEVRGEIFDQLPGGAITGTISANGYVAVLSTTCTFPQGTNEKIGFGKGDVTGTTGSFQAGCQGAGSGCFSLNTMSFSGALNGGLITGTFAISGLYRGAPSGNGTIREQASPATSTQVTLTLGERRSR